MGKKNDRNVEQKHRLMFFFFFIIQFSVDVCIPVIDWLPVQCESESGLLPKGSWVKNLPSCTEISEKHK